MKRELEKLAGMSGRKRLEYLWTYYRGWLAAVLFLALCGCEVCSTVRSAAQETLLSVVIVNGNRSDQTALDALEEELRLAVGATGKNEKILLDASVMTGEREAQEIKMTLSVSRLGENDLVICDAATYEKYQSRGAFVPWESVLAEEEQSFAQYLIAPDAVDLSMSRRWSELTVTDYEPVYCCIPQEKYRKENIRKVMRYLFF